ncbi:hypothetical protein [Nocardia salmonicida]|uniref:hypothetical protein n=1 Tax=Nocardia salmonicida TaxID=53431 RepID=UPI002E2BB08E|nr:hypothetical protein [Nocardia salmonicida]
MRYLRRDIGSRVVVQLDDVVWSGTLSACGRDHLELTHASAGVVGPTPADGRIVIPALQVHYVQVLAKVLG